jgi:hypothetical protein
MKKIFTGLTLAALLCIFSCSKPEKIYFDYNNQLFLAYLSAVGIDYELTDDLPVMFLESNRDVRKVAFFLSTSIEKSQINIANIDNTNFIDGNCFVPRKLTVNPGKATVEIFPDQTVSPKLRFDPTHPHAIREGANKGYVEIPNINLDFELKELTESSNFLKHVIDFADENGFNVFSKYLDENGANIYTIDKFSQAYFGIELPDIIDQLLLSHNLNSEDKIFDLDNQLESLGLYFYINGKSHWKYHKEFFYPIASMGCDGVTYGILDIPEQHEKIKNIFIEYDPLADEPYTVMSFDPQKALNYLAYFETEYCIDEESELEYINSLRQYFPEITPDENLEYRSITDILKKLPTEYILEEFTKDNFVLAKKSYFDSSVKFEDINSLSLDLIFIKAKELFEKGKYGTTILVVNEYIEKLIDSLDDDKEKIESGINLLANSYSLMGRVNAAERVLKYKYDEVMMFINVGKSSNVYFNEK